MQNHLLLSIPLWLKISYTAFALFIIPIYYKNWGPGNFLWFSDIALFVTAFALWMNSSLLASMMAVAVLLPEVGWNLDFFGRLLTGKNLLGLSDYMFQKDKSLFLRGLSLFHVILPALLILILVNYGYSEQALYYQTILAWIVLPLSYFLTRPEENVNWVYGPGSRPQKIIKAPLYLLLVMVIFPLCIYLPTHLLLRWIFNS